MRACVRASETQVDGGETRELIEFIYGTRATLTPVEDHFPCGGVRGKIFLGEVRTCVTLCNGDHIGYTESAKPQKHCGIIWGSSSHVCGLQPKPSINMV